MAFASHTLLHVVIVATLTTLCLGGCTTNMDCSLAGDCVKGECKCQPWTKGPDCAALNTVAAKTVAPLVSKDGNYTDSTRWGGSVAYEGGRYHLFNAEMAHGCTLGVWGYKSTVAHSVGASPIGPFTRIGVAIPAEAHNPVLSRAVDGTWLIWTCGCPHTPTPGCTKEAFKCPGGAQASWTTTVYSSMSLDGPWQPHVNMLGSNVTGGGVGTQNVSPLHKKDGSVFLMFKGPDNNTEASIASAPHWSGPYTMVAKNVFAKYYAKNITNEDVYWWQSDDGAYHALSHRMSPVDRTGAVSGGHAFAMDLTEWGYAETPAYTTTVNTVNGDVTLQRRERPQLLFSDESRSTPTVLYNAVIPKSAGNPHTFAQCLGESCPSTLFKF